MCCDDRLNPPAEAVVRAVRLIVMNHPISSPPSRFEDALALARQLLTEEDAVALRSKSLEEAIWTLHVTLGHQIRSALGLWNDDATGLFHDMTLEVPAGPALDADSASSALISALWQEANVGKDSS
ncbi:DUF6794 domain-containing protein [Roseateles chitinivorans]|uniref:DUF6794 domain-containing protein n=1 Tax=Roseateles chitinivorans TaxID=2917965 RepID=UPI003D66BC47